jgi:hypothetical protein
MQALRTILGGESPATKESNERMDSACAGCKAVLITAKDAAGSIGVPGLALGIGGLIFILDLIQACIGKFSA